MIFITVNGIRSRSHRVQNHLALFVGVVVVFTLLLASGSWKCLGAESNPPPPAISHIEETNSQALLHAYLQLQDQLRATQLAIEQNRQEAKAAAAQNGEALSKGLQAIQQAFSAQRAQDLEAKQSSNKVMLLVVGAFAALGLLTMFMISYFQWCMSKGLAEMSAALRTALEFEPGSAPAVAPAEQSTLRLLGTIEQLEKRTHELEQSSNPALRRRKGIHIENLLFPAPGDSLRRRQFRALKVAVIVGLICATVLALLLYVLTKGKLGLGWPQGH